MSTLGQYRLDTRICSSLTEPWVDLHPQRHLVVTSVTDSEVLQLELKKSDDQYIEEENGQSESGVRN